MPCLFFCYGKTRTGDPGFVLHEARCSCLPLGVLLHDETKALPVFSRHDAVKKRTMGHILVPCFRSHATPTSNPPCVVSVGLLDPFGVRYQNAGPESEGLPPRGKRCCCSLRLPRSPGKVSQNGQELMPAGTRWLMKSGERREPTNRSRLDHLGCSRRLSPQQKRDENNHTRCYGRRIKPERSDGIVILPSTELKSCGRPAGSPDEISTTRLERWGSRTAWDIAMQGSLRSLDSMENATRRWRRAT